MRRKSLALAFLLLPFGSARAAPEAVTPFRVEYAPGAGCPRIEGFSDALMQRSRHVRPARSGEAGFVFRIELLEEQGSRYGRLSLLEPNGRQTVRVVPGASCGEIMAALAVIAAVLVEPSA